MSNNRDLADLGKSAEAIDVDASAPADSLNIDSSGNVGIGTSSPTSYLPEGSNLVVSDSGHTGITLASGTTSEGGIFFADGTSGTDRYQGMIRYNHNSNYMEFRTSAGERMRINSSGYVTKPNQPAFSTSGFNNGTSGNIYASSTAVNIGSHYSTSTGKFTCPVAGVYYFSFWALISGDGYWYPRFLVNGGLYGSQNHNNPTSSSNTQTGFSRCIYLDVGDYVQVNINGTSASLYSGFGSFSGFLIG